MRGHSSGVAAVAWIGATEELVSAGTAGEIRAWRHLSQAAPTDLILGASSAGGRRKVCLSPDGTLLAATAGRDTETIIVDTAKMRTRILLPKSFLPVQFDPNGSELIGFSSEGLMQRWTVTTNPIKTYERKLFSTQVAVGSGVGWSRDGQWLAVGSTQGEIVFAFCPTGQVTTAISPRMGVVWFVAMSPDGRRALSGDSYTPRAILWQVEDGKKLGTVYTGSYAYCAAFSPDNRTFAIGWSNGLVEIRKIEGAHILHQIKTDSSRIQTLAYSPDGSRLAAGAPGGQIHLISTDDGREVLNLRASTPGADDTESTVSSLAFSDNGKALAAYLNNARIRIWRQ